MRAACTGPRRWAGGVAALEGVRTPSLVAKAVAELTDHHLLVGAGAQAFARQLGFEIEEDLNTDESRALWLEWRRRIDPGHWLDPRKRLEAALAMVDEGLIPAHAFRGTTNCDAVNADGDICGVTTTSGLSWKIPGRTGDSPILGAGLYVDNDVGAVGSTGRGEANLYNLSSFLAVEFMRQGMNPLDAGMATLERIKSNTVESRLLNERGQPNFDVRFFILDKQGETAAVAMYGSGETHYAVCTENGAEERPLRGPAGRLSARPVASGGPGAAEASAQAVRPRPERIGRERPRGVGRAPNWRSRVPLTWGASHGRGRYYGGRWFPGRSMRLGSPH